MRTNRSTGSHERSRRAVLRTAGASLAVGTTPLAGCMSTLPPLGQRVRFGRVDAPPRGDPVYSDWLPGPGVLRDGHDEDDADPLSSAMYVTPGDLGVEDTGAHIAIGESVMRTQVDYFGMGFDSYDWALAPLPGVVMAGDVDTETVHETLTETVYERSGTHLDFDLYRRTDRPHVVAVSGTHLVFDAGENAESNVRTLVDTGRGRGARYADVDGDADRLISAVGASPFTWYGFGTMGIDSFEDGGIDAEPVGSAHSYQYEDDAVYFVYDMLFPRGTVPTTGEIENALEERPQALRSAGVEVSGDGRLVTVEMRAEISDLRRGSSEPMIAPQITWRTSYDPDAEEFAITHLGGDTIDASWLVLHIGGSEVDRLSPTRGEIGPGDALTVDLSGRPEQDDVLIVMEDPNGNTSVTVFSGELPADGTDGASDGDGS